MRQEVIQFLEDMQIPGKTLGLHRMKSLMERLGNPQDKLKLVHVAGTNGKGSVCAMLSSVLIEADYKVGLFTSPHLIDYNERIRIQDIPIDNDNFIKLGLKIKDTCKEMVAQGEEMPTFFEYIAAMAFLYFVQQNVDIAIIETGIGGRYDGTNIIKNPLVSVITSIGMDHVALLGNTILEISREKGGIIKENSHTVLYDSDKSVYNTIKDICESKNNLLFSCQEALTKDEYYGIEGTTFTVSHPKFTYKDIYLQLLGSYQVSNAITTLMTVESLKLQGYHISQDVTYKGLKNAKWPGRMEVIKKNPTIMIDGAHNEESATAFVAALSGIKKDTKVLMLLSILKDKDYKGILDIIMPYAHTIIVTQSSNERALPAKTLYDQVKAKDKSLHVILEEDFKTAYDKGRQLLKENDILCCLGSLYLVGEIKQLSKTQEETHAKF